jgi:hypothetical protein
MTNLQNLFLKYDIVTVAIIFICQINYLNLVVYYL